MASCVVEYGDSASKKIIPVTLHAPKDSVEVIFDHLEEKSYLFYIYELDKNGNRSVKVQVTGTVYGEKYLSSITNRFISEITTSENAAIIKWALAGEGYVGSEITYKDQDGNSITRMVSADSDTTVIENWESMGNLSYRSFYKPEAQALDQFATETQTVKLPLIAVKIAKTDWKITGFSTEEPAEGGGQGLATALIDDDISTFWHSQWSGGNPPYPHWVSVDMGKEVTIGSFECFRRQGNGSGPSIIQFLVSTDGANWTDAGIFDFDRNTDAAQKFNLTAVPRARYFKFVALEGSNYYAHMAEINVFGQL